MEEIVALNERDTVHIVRPSVPTTCCVTGTIVDAGELSIKIQSDTEPVFATLSLTAVDALIDILEDFQPHEDFAKRQLGNAEAVVCYEHSYLQTGNVQCLVCGSEIATGSLLVFGLSFSEEHRLGDGLVASHADCVPRLRDTLVSTWKHASALISDSP